MRSFIALALAGSTLGAVVNRDNGLYTPYSAETPVVTPSAYSAGYGTGVSHHKKPHHTKSEEHSAHPSINPGGPMKPEHSVHWGVGPEKYSPTLTPGSKPTDMPYGGYPSGAPSDMPYGPGGVPHGTGAHKPHRTMPGDHKSGHGKPHHKPTGTGEYHHAKPTKGGEHHHSKSESLSEQPYPTRQPEMPLSIEYGLAPTNYRRQAEEIYSSIQHHMGFPSQSEHHHKATGTGEHKHHAKPTGTGEHKHHKLTCTGEHKHKETGTGEHKHHKATGTGEFKHHKPTGTGEYHGYEAKPTGAGEHKPHKPEAGECHDGHEDHKPTKAGEHKPHGTGVIHHHHTTLVTLKSVMPVPEYTSAPTY